MHKVYPHTKKMIDFSHGNVLGMCIPSSCDINELIESYNKVLSENNITVIAQNKCSIFDTNSSKFDLKIAISLIIFLVPFCICISTLFIDYDNPYLKPFSLKTNFNSIYRTYQDNDDSFIHGLKAVYMAISVPIHLIGIFYSAPYAAFLQGKFFKIFFFLNLDIKIIFLVFNN